MLKESDSDFMTTVYDVIFDFLVLPAFGTFFGLGFILIPLLYHVFAINYMFHINY